MRLEKAFKYYRYLKDSHYTSSLLTTNRLHKMHRNGKLAGYLDSVQDAYKRIYIEDQKQALEILKVRFHNQNLIGAFNEELTKEQEGLTGYAFSCCIGPSCNTSWTAICRAITTVDSRTASFVRNSFQVLEIDQLEDGELIFAVLERKDPAAERAHNLFWAYYVNNEPRAKAMAVGMKPVWKGQLADYYGHMYRRINF